MALYATIRLTMHSDTDGCNGRLGVYRRVA